MQSDIPKVLHRLAGKALLGHVIDTARSLEPSRICVVCGHGNELVRQHFPAEDLIWALQEPQLGTGHAVQQALTHLDMKLPTLVLYGDVPLIRHETLASLVDAASGGMAVLTVRMSEPSGYGRILRAEGGIIGIVEEKDATVEQRLINEVNTGVMIVPTPALANWLSRLSANNAQGEYYLTDIVAMAAAEGRHIAGVHPLDNWETMGVNSRSQLAQLESAYRQRLTHDLMEKGVTLLDPLRIDVRGSLICGRDCEIDVNCIFEGHVVLGDRVRIGANTLLRDVSVGSDTRVEPLCHLESALIGEHCRIGPYARIRPGTILSEHVHIGNFVEVKASRIGAQTKASHLSYLGDSEIGQRVNVGAGTITCNYDGVNKHRTVIEDDVFIGSDTQLVAPVKVGKGATIGAGTTLTQDAPEGKLTISRVRQATVSSWSRPGRKK